MGSLRLPILMRALRRKLKLSQKDMAKQLGVTPQYLNDLEHGRRQLTPVMVAKVGATFLESGPELDMWYRSGARDRGWRV